MKKIDNYIVKGFLGPYIMSFFVAEFVLVMQFLWKYIDEIIGKGFSIWVLFELIFYFAVTIIPMAIPLTVLISSVMVFGNLGERYELSSMKFAGVSLTRIMMGGILIAVLTAILSLFASNYLKPKANAKFYNRLYAIKIKKASLNFEEGVFNDEIKDYVIRINKKKQDDIGIGDIMVFDHSQMDKSKVNVITAKSGSMFSSENGDYFVMELVDGNQARDVTHKTSPQKDEQSEEPIAPFVRIKFGSWLKAFDMSAFDFKSNAAILTRKQYEFLNAKQLSAAADSVEIEMEKTLMIGNYDFGKLIQLEQIQEEKEEDGSKRFSELDKTLQESKKRNINLKNIMWKMHAREELDTAKHATLVDLYNRADAMKVTKAAKTVSRNVRDRVTNREVKLKTMYVKGSKFRIRLHQQFSWALVCIVFLFIGAPLGSIVRKGGYGYPLLVAIIFFMLFIVLNIMGEKLNSNQSIPSVLAAWLPNLVLIPAAFLLTFLALKDRKLGTFKALIDSLKS